MNRPTDRAAPPGAADDSAAHDSKARMLDATQDLVTLLDRDLRYVEVNRAYLEARGLTREQVIGATVPELWGSAILESAFAQAIARAFAGERVHYEASFEIPPGRLRFLEVFYQPLTGADGVVRNVVVTTRDRSEAERALRALRTLRDEAETARRRSEELLEETRQRLTASLSRLHEALYGGAEPADVRLRQARTAADAALAWLESSVNVPGPVTAAPVTVDLALVLEQVLAEGGRQAAEARGTTWVLELPATALPVAATSQRVLRQRLERALERGLARNPRGGLLMLRAVDLAGWIRLEVAPAGHRLEGEAQLEAEVAVRESTASGEAARPPGAADEEDGCGAESTVDGWKLWVDLPRAVEPTAAAEPSRVLVVDDHPVNRRLCRRLLEERGLGVDEAESGGEALAAIASRPYDLVLLDCRMEPIDGFEVARQIRAREAAIGADRLAVVAMTAGALAEDRERCLEAGMDAYLTKPLRVAELEGVLRQYTRSPERQGEPPALDPQHLAALADPADPGLFAELARLYLEKVRVVAEALESAVTAGDAEAIRSGAHGLRGASSAIGALRLAAGLRGLEGLAHEEARGACWVEVKGELERVVSALHRHL